MDNVMLENKLNSLARSKFRNSFHLNEKMINYVNEKGYDVIRNHAYDFIKKRLAMANPSNDGKQTPTRQVHPIFIAQHACACCCRGCLEKWHHINKGVALKDSEIDYIVNVLILWIKRECNR